MRRRQPFAGMVDQWWSSVKPQAQGDIGSVAQRFYDMGKNFMSMAEGMFGASGQEQPDAAMTDVDVLDAQAALQQWIAQDPEQHGSGDAGSCRASVAPR